MKKKRFLIVLLAIIAAVACIAGLCACGDSYTIKVDEEKSTVVYIGDDVDFTEYFIVTDKNGNQIKVTDEMLDTSKADMTTVGTFTITLNVGKASASVTLTAIFKPDSSQGGNQGNEGNQGNQGNQGNEGNQGNQGNQETNPSELSTVLAKYADNSKWNFAVTYQEVENNTVGYTDYYEYYGYNIKYTYDRYDDSDNYVGEATDYLGYNSSEDAFYLYYDNLQGSYTKYKEGTTNFTDYYYLYDIYLTELGGYSFSKSGSEYVAADPDGAGNYVIGEFTGTTWTKFAIKISNGYISQIDATMSDGYVLRFVFSKNGQVNFTLPNATEGGTTTPTEPDGTMTSQTYNPSTFDDERLQEKLTTAGEEPDPYVGLPSTGTYNALVIPVQIDDYEIKPEHIDKLNKAFNGTSTETGWESVSSYYQKASYGELNITFDISDVYVAKQTASYYESQTETQNGKTYNIGDNIILHEALAALDSEINYSKYDWNKDGAIDAVYIIYSAPIDYVEADFWWAYVTWNDDKTQYDGKNVFYYMFTGLDFMNESVNGGYVTEYYPEIKGLKINASTFIHESGHLLGLDDYYDYEENLGSGEGLGGADMMDATVGDQNVYSKIMLGWLTPTIVTTTQTITIKSSQEQGDAILIPLNFNNSYFCEYLLIDLYSAQGLNALHASAENSYLYDGADYGVRIYHVSSWINDPWNNDFGSFTDNNNSSSTNALIKLVEADGTTKFSDSDGWAMEDDLWEEGQSLSSVFPNYTTYGNKLLNFDITINSVDAEQASIKITYNT